MQNIWPVLLPISEAAAMVLAARVLRHYFQLESYQFRGYFKTILRQWKRAFLDIGPVWRRQAKRRKYLPMALESLEAWLSDGPRPMNGLRDKSGWGGNNSRSSVPSGLLKSTVSVSFLQFHFVEVMSEK